MRELRLKHYEPYASARRDIAHTIRALRRKNPAMAWLLVRRMREAENKIAHWFWNYTGDDRRGLSVLLGAA